MKQIKTLLLAIGLVWALSSCDTSTDNTPDFDNYQGALGYIDTTLMSDYDYGITLDNNETLIPVMVDDEYYTAKHGERIFVIYSIINADSLQSEAILHSINPITVKEAIAYTPEDSAIYGNEPSFVNSNSLWQTSQLLNAHIGYMSNGLGRHTMVLTVPHDLEKDNMGNYILDLFHNDNGFKGSSYFEGIISFDLSSLSLIIPEADEGITFVIRHNRGLDSESIRSKVFTYPFDNSPDNIDLHFESTINLK